MTIPDWAWKVLQLMVIPVALWAIATHVSIKNHELRVNAIEQKITTNEQELDSHRKDISNTQNDMEILKVRMEYVVKGIDEIKDMIEEDRKERKYAK
jgi:septal ring factor EnvC (AmiA/AmiB activator)